MFVLDGSVTMAWCFVDEANPYADAVAKRAAARTPVVPGIWPLEVANAFLVGERRGRCDRDDTIRWLAFLRSMRIAIDSSDRERVFNDVVPLARKHDLSSYDAAYLELSVRLELPLATCDKPLMTAAHAAGVEIFDPND